MRKKDTSVSGKDKDRKPSAYAFIARVGGLAVIPLLPFIVLYFSLDPFKVLYHHDDYFSDGLGVNKGVVSVNAFESQNDARNYDSFIVGASISCYYPVEEWKKYLPADARPIHIDSSGQPVSVMRLFMEYLDREATDMRNVLIVLNTRVLKEKYRPDLLPGKFPVALNPTPAYWWDFNYKYFRSFASYAYFASYIPWRLTGVKHDYTDAHLFEPQPIKYDRTINEETIPEWDYMIENDSASFYSVYNVVTPEPGKPFHRLDNILSDQVKEDLAAIAGILKRRGSHAKVIVAPALDLGMLSEEDDLFMRQTFGDAYHNLTGEFREELSDAGNFYDNTHYRPVLAVKHLRMVYGADSIAVSGTAEQ